jgi:hypothetical protein
LTRSEFKDKLHLIISQRGTDMNVSSPKLTLSRCQLQIIYAMERLEFKQIQKSNIDRSEKIGIFLDPSNSEKIMIFLALIKRDKNFSGYGWGTRCTRRTPLCSLVLADQTTLDQWEYELKNNTSLRYFKINNRSLVSDTKSLAIDLACDVILCETRIFRQIFNKISTFMWNKVIVDDNVNVILELKQIYFNYIWFMTERDWSRFNLTFNYNLSLIRSKFYGSSNFREITVKYNPLFIQNVVRHNIKCLSTDYIQIISSYITPKIKDMIDKDRIKDAMRAIGGNFGSATSVSQTITKKIQEEIDIKKERIQNAQLGEDTLISKLGKEIESCNTRLDSIKERIANTSTEICVICMDVYTHPVLLSCCNNIFCLECITTALKYKNNCLMCTEYVNPMYFTYLCPVNVEKYEEKKFRLKTKDEECIEIILKNSKKKILIIFYGRTDEKKIENVKLVLKNKEVKYSCTEDIYYGRIAKDSCCNVSFYDLMYPYSTVNLQDITDIIVYTSSRFKEFDFIKKASKGDRDPYLKLDIHYLISD